MFHNREIRRFAALLCALTAASAGVGFLLSPAAGALALASAAAFCAAFFAFTRARYARLARLSDEIDRVLHNADHLYIAEAEEGELSILHSEITKMTLRIREQNEALKREKEHLADSLADVAHQLRTPLTSVSLLLSLLESEPDADRRRAFLREAEELFSQMDWLLDALLKLSRLDAGIVTFQNEEIEVERLLSEAVRPFLISMELHDIALQQRVPGGMTVRGDGRWLSQAVSNLLKNCLQSAGDGGRIEIVCADTPLYAEIVLHDSGPGFESADLPRLFERFYRGKSTNAAGYGIGLALCRSILVRQGATIAAKNHPQGGAMFVIRFPK